jgi:DNA polymerase-3 subunit gamma/tau
VRDSLSALDQAIASCGNRLDAEQVRSLLGSFSLDAMAQVTAALASLDGNAALTVVDELERNGGSPQHFSRELSRYLRNLLVTKISGADSRLVTASPSERSKMAQIAAGFSEEDLTRYLQLALDLFKDLQFSLQPRFHLEIGLLKMVQAGKLIPIEEAIASLGKPPVVAPQAPKPVIVTPPPAAPKPVANADWRNQLHAAMMATGLKFSADAIAQSDVAMVNGELQITTSKQFQLDLGREEVMTALKHLAMPAQRFKVLFGDVKAAAPIAKPVVKEDEATERALAHPEVQKFRELFGGEVRTVRNLKES